MNASSADRPCVVHLVWAPLGMEPFRRFVGAYRENPGGIRHRLLVVYNGFTLGEHLADYRAELNDIAHDELILPKPVQDLTAYFAAAEMAPENSVCFLNSYSEPLDPQWLRKLWDGFNQPGTGAVGATGSAESMLSYLKGYCFAPERNAFGRVLDAVVFSLRYPLAWMRFPRFPNYHLRTNAFLIGRDVFLRMRRQLLDKASAEQLESGRRGVTAQLRAWGLGVGVVGRNGVCYAPECWAASHTFRSGEQENLLVADNRTLQYAQADTALRAFLSEAAWGKKKLLETP